MKYGKTSYYIAKSCQICDLFLPQFLAFKGKQKRLADKGERTFQINGPKKNGKQKLGGIKSRKEALHWDAEDITYSHNIYYATTILGLAANVPSETSCRQWQFCVAAGCTCLLTVSLIQAWHFHLSKNNERTFTAQANLGYSLLSHLFHETVINHPVVFNWHYPFRDHSYVTYKEEKEKVQAATLFSFPNKVGLK